MLDSLQIQLEKRILIAFNVNRKRYKCLGVNAEILWGDIIHRIGSRRLWGRRMQG